MTRRFDTNIQWSIQTFEKSNFYNLPSTISKKVNLLVTIFNGIYFCIQGKSTKAVQSSVLNRSETPILAAERKMFRDQEQHGNRKQPVYMPDRINRRSTYKLDYVDYKKQSKSPKKSKPRKQQSPPKIVGGRKGGKEIHTVPVMVDENESTFCSHISRFLHFLHVHSFSLTLYTLSTSVCIFSIPSFTHFQRG